MPQTFVVLSLVLLLLPGLAMLFAVVITFIIRGTPERSDGGGEESAVSGARKKQTEG